MRCRQAAAYDSVSTCGSSIRQVQPSSVMAFWQTGKRRKNKATKNKGATKNQANAKYNDTGDCKDLRALKLEITKLKFVIESLRSRQSNDIELRALKQEMTQLRRELIAFRREEARRAEENRQGSQQITMDQQQPNEAPQRNPEGTFTGVFSFHSSGYGWIAIDHYYKLPKEVKQAIANCNEEMQRAIDLAGDNDRVFNTYLVFIPPCQMTHKKRKYRCGDELEFKLCFEPGGVGAYEIKTLKTGIAT